MALVIALVLLLVALLLWRLASGEQQATGLPASPVHYDDSGARPPRKPLVSHRYRLTGRPDYLLEIEGRIIPVEVKPNRRAKRPYRSDLMQIAAYCLLVEEVYGEFPPYGILKYADQSWEIPYTGALRQQLLETVALMRETEQFPDVPRHHEYPNRCARCSVLAYCDQNLLI